MKRREFLTASVAVGAASISGIQAHAAAGKQQIIELIKYRLNIGKGKNRVADYYRDAAIPALNRAGIKNVGVFTVVYGPNDPSLWVLIPHPDMESVLTTPQKLFKDQVYLKAGADYLDATQETAAFVRKESQLLQAFSHMPAVQAPTAMMSNNNRIYEIRIYESPGVKTGNKKVEMFNEGGEIEIFKKSGLSPVFFGQTIVGDMMPNLNYMLAFESMEARDKNWDVFRNHPDWLKLRAEPQYLDLVSNITDIILRPAPFSQI